MTDRTYFAPPGGLPPQSELLTGRAVFTESYAVIPHGTMRDITTSALPFWDRMRAWVIARPMSGFSETFSHYIMDIAPGGGSDRPETDKGVETALFVTQGRLLLTIGQTPHQLEPGSFAYIQADTQWRLRNESGTGAGCHWVRKAYQSVDGLAAPDPIVTSDAAVQPTPMPDTNGAWATTRFMDPGDLRHDMHITIVTLQPGAVIPFLETHVMEHGLYVLQGKGVYRLNRDWVEVEAGDFMWLRAFCPQACYAGGPEPFRYLLYKDVNRHMPLG